MEEGVARRDPRLHRCAELPVERHVHLPRGDLGVEAANHAAALRAGEEVLGRAVRRHKRPTGLARGCTAGCRGIRSSRRRQAPMRRRSRAWPRTRARSLEGSLRSQAPESSPPASMNTRPPAASAAVTSTVFFRSPTREPQLVGRCASHRRSRPASRNRSSRWRAAAASAAPPAPGSARYSRPSASGERARSACRAGSSKRGCRRHGAFCVACAIVVRPLVCPPSESTTTTAGGPLALDGALDRAGDLGRPSRPPRRALSPVDRSSPAAAPLRSGVRSCVGEARTDEWSENVTSDYLVSVRELLHELADELLRVRDAGRCRVVRGHRA